MLEQKSEDYEIIVVDDASRDRTSQVLNKFAHPRIKILTNEENRGPAYSRNRGIKEAMGEFILFVDSDCVADLNWISQITLPFEQDPAIMLISGKTLDAPSSSYWEMVNEGINFIAYHNGYVTKAYTCNMAARKSFLDQNPFDESLVLPFSEDLDLSIRCIKQHLKIFHTSNAQVIHFHRSTFKTTIISNFNCGIYNTLVRFKRGQFPYMNYGTYLLILTICLTSIDFIALAHISLSVYLGLILFLSFRADDRNLFKIFLCYPGRFVAAIADCLGNISALLVYFWKV